MKEWASTSNLTVGQPRYLSLPGRWLCVPFFRKVCLFHNYLHYYRHGHIKTLEVCVEIMNYFRWMRYIVIWPGEMYRRKNLAKICILKVVS